MGHYSLKCEYIKYNDKSVSCQHIFHNAIPIVGYRKKSLISLIIEKDKRNKM